MLELIAISKAGVTWYLNKVVLNPDHIVLVTESREHNRLLLEGELALGLDSQVSFSKVKMSATSGFDELIVVGSPVAILEKMNTKTKQLLKG